MTNINASYADLIKTDFASYVRADSSGDKGELHAIRMGHVHGAFIVALLGNKTPYMQASGAAVGKTRVARAYREAFKACTAPEKIDYKGKATPEVRAQAAAQALTLCEAFSAAFLSVAPVEAPVLTGEEKAAADAKAAAAKAKREATATQKALDIAKAKGFVLASETRAHTDLTPAALADLVADMIGAGTFTRENVDVIAQACALRIKAEKAAAQRVNGTATAPKGEKPAQRAPAEAVTA
jgi:hypothetical protein